jgi:hypothetical protein
MPISEWTFTSSVSDAAAFFLCQYRSPRSCLVCFVISFCPRPVVRIGFFQNYIGELIAKSGKAGFVI